MKIAYLGSGTWGVALSSLLAEKGHEVTVWSRNRKEASRLAKARSHPKLPGFQVHAKISFTSDLEEALWDAEAIVESVTSEGIRPVFEEVYRILSASAKSMDIPMILTSKGIEQATGLLLPEVISEIFQMPTCPWVGALSGPSQAEEVIHQLPTSITAAAYDPEVTELICELFTTPTLRIYPVDDLHGICFGGAVKNIIAIACGIADGLMESINAKAALMTLGLHEMRRLSLVKDCQPETLSGLAGLGDLCVTCFSSHSRNFRFGRLIAEGLSPEEARQKIGMAVEGIYTCLSAKKLGEKHQVSLPITESIYSILYEGASPQEALRALLTESVEKVLTK